MIRPNANYYISSYPGFLRWALSVSTTGSVLFYVWMFALTAIFLVGANAWAVQVSEGMIVTNMTDHVSWGLYIANFTFMVGLAAGGVMMVIPAYVYNDKKMLDVVILGELLAIAAIVMCLMFVMADLGRPERAWHLIPFLGRFNWPMSMLTWDVIVLNGYLLLNRLPALHAVSWPFPQPGLVLSVCNALHFLGNFDPHRDCFFVLRSRWKTVLEFGFAGASVPGKCFCFWPLFHLDFDVCP